MVDEESSGRKFGWEEGKGCVFHGSVTKTFLTLEVPFVFVRREAFGKLDDHPL